MKQNFFYVFAISLLVFIASCQGGNKPANDDTVIVADLQNEGSVNDTTSNFTMKTAQEVYSDASEIIKVAITNNSKEEVFANERYSLEYYNGAVWAEIPLDLMFIDLAYGLLPGDTKDFNINLPSENQNYKSGKYRIIKTLMSAEQTYSLKTEFSIK